ncbi:MAG: isoprenylcysteine carboxylmethyltransferase family protein [Zoogloeaceae bacterium]|jgi:protein-S-isoprenylcysteine O-methyltransferase Ste14|nr:isoprenylcysteine carboxylmethyltransferase family protein [Zoogloeaceae bacterium]
MFRAWLKAVLLLPANVLIFIPAVILYCSDGSFELARGWRMVLGFGLMSLGLILAIWTMTLFHKKGKGTAAPWNPPKKLVVAGPYRHVRNPMLSSVFMMLMAECLLFGVWQLWVFFFIFLAANMVYFPLVEEKELEKRFGEDYLRYKANVPRYIPRLGAWNP